MYGSKERTIWKRILEVYRDTPHLWDKNHSQYKNLSLRMKSFRALLDIYHEFDEEATLDVLKNKLMNMRTSFLREYKKAQLGVPTESDSEQTTSYKPTLWYYDQLLFLQEQDYVYAQKSTDNEESNYTSDTQSTPPYKKIRLSIKNDKSEKKVHQVADQTSYKAEDMDEFDSFGRMITLELKKLRHPHQPIAQKLISDVLYYAKMGKLTENTSISIPDNVCTVETHYYDSSPEVEKLDDSE